MPYIRSFYLVCSIGAPTMLALLLLGTRRFGLFRVKRSKREIATISRENYLPQDIVSNILSREIATINTENYLPLDIVWNILSRLPARELWKCKCVCKSWFDLITDPHFVSYHYSFYNNLKFSQSQEEHLLVIRRPFNSSLKTCISVLSWNVNKPKGVVSSEVLNPPYEFNFEHKYWSEVMGPCNGIYFLEGNPGVMMNPSLRQFKTLPESQLTGSHGTYSVMDHAGFGFDPKTNDYKVVVLKETGKRQSGYWTAELYSLNSNSWRKLDAVLPLPIKIWGICRFYTYVKNCCHWWGFVDDSGGRTGYVVLAFNMVTESFRMIRAPKIRCSSGECFKTLAPSNDSATIGVIVYPLRGSEKCFDVWVMKDYWDEGSWIKQYSFGPVPVIYNLVGFYGNNRFLWKDNNERLVLYEPDSECARDLQVYGKYDSIRAGRYMESLVSLLRENEISHPCFSM